MRGILKLGILLAISLGGRFVAAQPACDEPYRPPHAHRYHPRASHRPPPGYHAPCPCATCRKLPCDEPTAAAEVQGAPAGAFAVPPQSGEVVGASNAMGIRGAEITMPAIRLTLPSIRFPSLFRSRQDAYMQVNSAVAPLSQPMPTVAVPPSQVMAFQGAGVAGAQGSEGKPEPGDDLSAQEKRLDEKLKEIQRCLKRLEALQYATPPTGPCGHAPGHCDCAQRGRQGLPAPSVHEPQRMAYSPSVDQVSVEATSGSDGTIRQLVHQREIREPVHPLTNERYDSRAYDRTVPRGSIVDMHSLRRLPDTLPSRH